MSSQLVKEFMTSLVVASSYFHIPLISAASIDLWQVLGVLFLCVGLFDPYLGVLDITMDKRL